MIKSRVTAMFLEGTWPQIDILGTSSQLKRIELGQWDNGCLSDISGSNSTSCALLLPDDVGCSWRNLLVPCPAIPVSLDNLQHRLGAADKIAAEFVLARLVQVGIFISFPDGGRRPL